MTGVNRLPVVRVPSLGGLLLLGMAVVVAGVGVVTGGLLLLGLAGGVLVGAVLLFASAGRGPYRSTDATPRHDPAAAWPPSDVINMSRIRVTGVGGLGLVAMATAVAIGVPSIGRAMVIAVVGGAIVALAIIAIRRRNGPLPSHPPQLLEEPDRVKCMKT
jgi:hypothetical protein